MSALPTGDATHEDAEPLHTPEATPEPTSEATPLPTSKATSKAPEPEAVGLRAYLAGAPLPQEMAVVLGLALPALLLAANLWRVHPFTVDDSFISYRYARNLANGLGLVYNAGERIEGYTNFLFTVLLAGGIKLGIDPELLSKLVGGASAFGSLALTYVISGRLLPYRTIPCVATWLLASSIVFTGWSIFGLETGFFVFLLLAGTLLFLRENDGDLEAGPRPAQLGSAYRVASGPVTTAGSGPARVAFPWSGAVFALAALTRPEAPMFIGILMVALLCRPFDRLGPDAPVVKRVFAFLLGRRFITAQNLLRLAVFWVPLAQYLAFRHHYYGSFVPNTASAKTGNFEGQIIAGANYVQNYANHAGPVLYLALIGLALGIVTRRRDVLALAAISLFVLAYIIVVGGDWMKFFRFMAPFEPFCFLLVCLGVRRVGDKRDAIGNLAFAMFAVMTVAWRAGSLRDAQADLLLHEKKFWDTAAGGTADWLLKNGQRGELALGDIGYVGWKTDYPILDLLGLVDPVIAKLPGGYTQKVGKGFTDRLFEKQSMYVLIISSNMDCQHPSVLGSQVIYNDPRFRQQYKVGGKVPLDGGFAWCIYQRK
jgi:arabinofuranosyltransferase